MGYKIDLKGQKFGRLLVIDFAFYKKEKTFWKCKCECGNETIVRSDCLKSKNSSSCGCYGKEQRQKATLKHNLTFKCRLYNIWQDMKARCYNKNKYCYKDYGARGIKVCDEWKNDFLNFYNWAKSNGYKDNLSIDRIDNYKDYTPQNCRWATSEEQNYNKRNTIIIENDGIKYTILDLYKKFNIPKKILWYRINKNKRFEEIIRK